MAADRPMTARAPRKPTAVPEAETAQSIPNHARNGGLDLRL